jgi:DNA helicase-2/ATP-dependent DNA helicase PcrA
MMAYFKLAVNCNDDEAFKRVVNKPARGIGDTSVNALAAAASAGGTSLFKAACLPNLESFGLRGAAVTKIRAFCDLVSKVDAASGTAWDTAMTLASESGMYLLYKADTSIEGQSRFANVQELLDSVKAYEEEVQGNFVNALVEDGVVTDASEVPAADLPKVTLGEYLENVSLLSNVDVAEDETRNRVALMTVHSAKGLEFPYVYLTGMEENLFPSGGWMLTPKDLEEERRLFYVGLTRAKKVATVSFAHTRMRNGKHESNGPSRFLREIAPQYLDKPLRREDLGVPSFDGDFADERRSFARPATPRGFIFGDGAPKTKSPLRPSFTAPRASTSTGSTAPSSSPKPQFAPRPDIIDANFVPDPMSSFKVGDRIEHNRFGAGQVLEIIGRIPELKAKIHFDQYGDKLLLLKFAKLRHIQ